MDAMTFDYPLPGRTPTSPHSQLARPNRAKYTVRLVPDAVVGSVGEIQLSRTQTPVFHIQLWRLCEFREVVSTLVSPGGVKDEKGVVRLPQRSHDGRTGRSIRDRRDSRVGGPMGSSRSGTRDDHRDQQVGCRRCSPMTQTREGMYAPSGSTCSCQNGLVDRKEGKNMTSLYGHLVDRSVSWTILTC